MVEPGLCGTCEYVKRTESKRGSVFYMCLLASRDETLRKYPPLPVRRCHGYRPTGLPPHGQASSPEFTTDLQA
jgi:hypothetical protein